LQCGKEGHIADECPDWRRAAKSLLRVNHDNKRQLWPEPCQVKQLLSTIVWKAPHQQVLEANLGDRQKELVVKSLVLWNCRELREFLKWVNHYCCFVKDNTAVIKPLTVLTSPKVKWAWNDAQQQAHNNIKEKVGTSQIFTNPVKGKPFCLCPGASDYAVGAALEQEGKDGQWHVVAYGSHSLTNAERKWSSTEKECFAVVHFMNHWLHLLLGAQFEVLTGHQALSKIFGQAEPPTGMLARWILKMQPFQPFNVKYRPGQVNNNSDGLSRQPIARLVAAIEPVKKTGNVEELREDPAFEWILKALNRDESGCQGKMTRQLALLDHMVINENGELYHTHWPQGKTAIKGISLQWVVPKSRREQLLALHHNTPVGGHLGHDKLFG